MLTDKQKQIARDAWQNTQGLPMAIYAAVEAVLAEQGASEPAQPPQLFIDKTDEYDMRDKAAQPPAGMVERIKRNLEIMLNNHVLEMKPEMDDSIVGFNEAVDVMRELFAKVAKNPENYGAAPAAVCTKERDAEWEKALNDVYFMGMSFNVPEILKAVRARLAPKQTDVEKVEAILRKVSLCESGYGYTVLSGVAAEIVAALKAGKQ
jgi:hypothetical protein